MHWLGGAEVTITELLAEAEASQKGPYTTAWVARQCTLLPALLAWAREARRLLEKACCTGGSRCWYGGMTGDLRMHHADDCLVTLRDALLTRDVEVTK